jgi:FkbM family methyltransferase
MNFLRTAWSFRRNPFINPWVAMLRHGRWGVRRVLNLFPCDLRVGPVMVRVPDSVAARGPAALLNAVGYYDPNNMRFLQEVISAGLVAVFIDVGANLGIYSLLAAASSSKVKVIAVEPHPRTFELLRQNVSLNGKGHSVTCCQVALADFNGTTYLSDRAVGALNAVLGSGARKLGGLKITARRGADVCSEYRVAPEFLKIDVEGYEIHVLEGFGRWLSDCRLALVESKSVFEVGALMRQHADFLGPYKVDLRRRRLSSAEIHGEDWLFLNSRWRHEFREWLP